MSNLWLVMKTVNKAAGFVLDNKTTCIYRAFPIMIGMIAVGSIQFLNPTQNGANSDFTQPYSIIGLIISTLLYSIFAVSWHRFTILPEERARKGFPLRLGKREMKFAWAYLVTTLIIVAASELLTSVLPEVLAVILLLLLMVALGVILLFMFPAIALDQPIRTGLFLKKGSNLLLSLIIAVCICMLYLVVLMFVFMIFMWIIGDIISPVIAAMIVYVAGNILLAPILLAISTSTASFLFQDVIGLKEIKSADSGETLAATDK